MLRASDRGTTVLGSSSMGALRAAECEPFGVVGIGRIYEEFASGRVDADDEVAIVYDTETLAPLSEPLINWRLMVRDGIYAERIPEGTGQRFLELAKEVYVPRRTLDAVMRLLRRELDRESCDRLEEYVSHKGVDSKREDALELLRAVAACVAVPEQPRGRWRTVLLMSVDLFRRLANDSFAFPMRVLEAARDELSTFLRPRAVRHRRTLDALFRARSGKVHAS
ncbi:MAG: hypothetical protein CSB46_11475 [Micrococcales bacterium]|nr:MAG: hypothetical protein CSB46_11475 [Micrococcales bacterium]